MVEEEAAGDAAAFWGCLAEQAERTNAAQARNRERERAERFFNMTRYLFGDISYHDVFGRDSLPA